MREKKAQEEADRLKKEEEEAEAKQLEEEKVPDNVFLKRYGLLLFGIGRI